MNKGLVCLTFDNMGSAYEVGIGARGGPDPEEISLAVGYPRVLKLLEELELKATFFVEGWNALHHPERVRELVNRGHEVGVHGWVHEKFAALDAIQAERVLVDALAAFRNAGLAPTGFRAPGGIRGVHTEALLTALGFAYDSSIDDTHTLEPGLLNPQLVNIPWAWSMNDYYCYHMAPDEASRTPERVEGAWLGLLDRAAASGGLVTFTFHAMCSGADDVAFGVMSRVLRAVLAHPRLDIVNAATCASRIAAQH